MLHSSTSTTSDAVEPPNFTTAPSSPSAVDYSNSMRRPLLSPASFRRRMLQSDLSPAGNESPLPMLDQIPPIHPSTIPDLVSAIASRTEVADIHPDLIAKVLSALAELHGSSSRSMPTLDNIVESLQRKAPTTAGNRGRAGSEESTTSSYRQLYLGLTESTARHIAASLPPQDSRGNPATLVPDDPVSKTTASKEEQLKITVKREREEAEVQLMVLAKRQRGETLEANKLRVRQRKEKAKGIAAKTIIVKCEPTTPDEPSFPSSSTSPSPLSPISTRADRALPLQTSPSHLSTNTPSANTVSTVPLPRNEAPLLNKTNGLPQMRAPGAVHSRSPLRTVLSERSTPPKRRIERPSTPPFPPPERAVPVATPNIIRRPSVPTRPPTPPLPPPALPYSRPPTPPLPEHGFPSASCKRLLHQRPVVLPTNLPAKPTWTDESVDTRVFLIELPTAEEKSAIEDSSGEQTMPFSDVAQGTRKVSIPVMDAGRPTRSSPLPLSRQAHKAAGWTLPQSAGSPKAARVTTPLADDALSTQAAMLRPGDNDGTKSSTMPETEEVSGNKGTTICLPGEAPITQDSENTKTGTKDATQRLPRSSKVPWTPAPATIPAVNDVEEDAVGSTKSVPQPTSKPLAERISLSSSSARAQRLSPLLVAPGPAVVVADDPPVVGSSTWIPEEPSWSPPDWIDSTLLPVRPRVASKTANLAERMSGKSIKSLAERMGLQKESKSPELHLADRIALPLEVGKDASRRDQPEIADKQGFVPFPSRDESAWCENHQAYGHSTQHCRFPNSRRTRQKGSEARMAVSATPPSEATVSANLAEISRPCKMSPPPGSPKGNGVSLVHRIGSKGLPLQRRLS